MVHATEQLLTLHTWQSKQFLLIRASGFINNVLDFYLWAANHLIYAIVYGGPNKLVLIIVKAMAYVLAMGPADRTIQLLLIMYECIHWVHNGNPLVICVITIKL